MGIDDVVLKIRRKSREEWEELAHEGWTELRIWAHEHGERAAVVAFFVGIVIVLAFKLVIAIAALAVLAAYVVWFIARPNSEKEEPSTQAKTTVVGEVIEVDPKGVQSETEKNKFS